MDALCLLAAGVLRTVLHTVELSVQWQHSVEKTQWEERYRVVADRLELVEARVQALGAGMEPGAEAALENGWWRWSPKGETLPELRLTFSTYASDYRLCWRGRCSELAPLLGGRPADGTVVEVRACPSGTLPDRERDRD